MELSRQEIARYKRHLLLPEIGEDGQLALKKARVLVIGAGGLGNAVIPYLTAAGVGDITIVDKDTVDISNLQRQVLFTEEDLGKYKAKTLVDKLRVQNSGVNFHIVNDFFTGNNALELTKNHDVIIDCVDQINARYLINDVSVYFGIPMIYGAIHKFEGQVSVFNYKEGATYRCAFPENNAKTTPQNCEDAGVIGVLPGIIGMYQAMEVIKILTGSGKVMTNKILMVDLLNNFHQTISITRAEESIQVSRDRIEKLLSSSPVDDVLDILGEDLEHIIAKYPDIKIIDIQYETNVESLGGVKITHIPVSQFEVESMNLNKEQTILLYCAHGGNSQWATQHLKQNNFKRIYHLVGGITSV